MQTALRSDDTTLDDHEALTSVEASAPTPAPTPAPAPAPTPAPAPKVAADSADPNALIKGTYRLKTHHGKWLQVYSDHTVNANSDNPGAWEEFTFHHVRGNTYRLQTHHGKWLQVYSDHTVNANSD